MKKKPPLTDEQIAELTIAEFKKLPKAIQKKHFESDYFRQTIEREKQWLKDLKKQRADLRGELSPDDASELRWLLELREETGLNIDRLQDGFTLQGLEEITKAAIGKRKAKLKWHVVKVADCKASRSSLKRDADNPDFDYIRHTNRQGYYLIREDWLHAYT